MKKILFTTLLASSALLIFAKPANAEEVGNEQTDLGIRFDTDGPNKPGQGPFKDNLALVWTPSKFDFGRQAATANIATYSNTVAGDQYIVVNDDRQEAETSGWKVTAKLSKLVSSDSSATELPSKLTFTLGDAQSYGIGEVDPDTNDFLPNPIEGNLGKLADSNNITVSKSVTLEAGNTTSTNIIAKTKADAVKGGFATKLSDTKLTVTKGTGAAGKAFNASVNWSLDNTY
ncbi:WxL domain-containing protein [Enterococcus caccae]|uniref:WxL domain-containing protein n=1 Tax=Enterococcus caccae ATCC BAA-1240 TaxID=1158612 RepID=R3UA91_9ENTE|nr:WxL domain-containing protein [Enterococcus caccae]EOL50919.1 hypothetical protein UC7_00032 [Enterococcus caccae ATCC BAA-1240]EOT59526.1 hypothetical protein I580_02558 [Enterococcus caccae ATCC BAA-1240]OJG23569.1 hypothetical protein RU98_GL001824 [Enterococcus caccae]